MKYHFPGSEKQTENYSLYLTTAICKAWFVLEWCAWCWIDGCRLIYNIIWTFIFFRSPFSSGFSSCEFPERRFRKCYRKIYFFARLSCSLNVEKHVRFRKVGKDSSKSVKRTGKTSVLTICLRLLPLKKYVFVHRNFLFCFSTLAKPFLIYLKHFRKWFFWINVHLIVYVHQYIYYMYKSVLYFLINNTT